MAFYHGAIFLERKFTTKVQQTSPGGSLCAFRRACGLQGFSRSLTGYFIYGAAFRRSFNERRLPARLSRTLPRRWHSTEPQNSAKYTTDRVRSLYKRPICEQVLSSIECFIVIFSANSFFFDCFGIGNRIAKWICTWTCPEELHQCTVHGCLFNRCVNYLFIFV